MVLFSEIQSRDLFCSCIKFKLLIKIKKECTRYIFTFSNWIKAIKAQLSTIISKSESQNGVCLKVICWKFPSCKMHAQFVFNKMAEENKGRFSAQPPMCTCRKSNNLNVSCKKPIKMLWKMSISWNKQRMQMITCYAHFANEIA